MRRIYREASEFKFSGSAKKFKRSRSAAVCGIASATAQKEIRDKMSNFRGRSEV